MSNRFARRRLLGYSAVGASLWYTPGLFAEWIATPPQTEGPFYPDKLPLDTDNDLLIINNALTPGVGEISHLHGKVMDLQGNPIRNAVVEIWQVNGKGAYIHSRSANADNTDQNFQGFGRFLTGSTGEYYFRTVKPVPYPGRTPHIHVKVKKPGFRDFTTQCYINGHPQNSRDGVLRRISQSAKQYQALMVDFKPIPESKVGELDARFDIVIGLTPSDA